MFLASFSPLVSVDLVWGDLPVYNGGESEVCMMEPVIVFTGKLDDVKEVGDLLLQEGIDCFCLNPSGGSSS